ncbi:response regulator transcription factor [Arcobacter sp. CECT 8986]|uniref:response regulator transcription factor n=1 Tax=Arcobacter sp. CECT 8986 TaxID=2044507 RepID=UPI0013E93457|nr:response regulator [Arcobacter sp. CECT 8986]
MENSLKDLVVLYVEDQKEAQIELKHVFDKTFKKTIIANNGEEGLKLFLSHKKRNYNIDIIITDINMPKLNGIDLIKEVKKYDTNVKFVLTTAYTEVEYLLEAIELGVTAYIVKPINIVKLLEKIECAYKEKIDNDKLNNIVSKMKEHNIKNVDEFFTVLDDTKKDDSDIINLSDGFSYNYKNKVLIKEGKTIALVNQEILLLEYFIQNPNKILTYEELLEAITVNTTNTSLNNLRTVIKSLRKKSSKELITNLSGVGYKLILDKN